MPSIDKAAVIQWIRRVVRSAKPDTNPASGYAYEFTDGFDLQALNSSGTAFTQRPIMPGGRLTLTTGTPVTTSDVTAAGTLYYTPYIHDLCPVYNTTDGYWQTLRFSELSLSLSGYAANTCYDIFAYNNSGSLALESLVWNSPASSAITSISNASPPVVTVTSSTSGLANDDLVTIAGNTDSDNNSTWKVASLVANTSFTILNLDNSNPSAPGSVGTGGTWQQADDSSVTRATALVRQNGVLCKTGALSRRYLGTICITPTAAQCEDSVTRRFVFNYYNPVQRVLTKFTTASTHTYDVASYRAWNQNANYRLAWVHGVLERPIWLRITSGLYASVAGSVGIVALGPDSSSAAGGTSRVLSGNTDRIDVGDADWYLPSAAGYHFAQLLEFGNANAVTFQSAYVTGALWA